jgi:hypothetical protein
MSKVIYYAPLDGDGEIRLDPDSCLWRHTIVQQDVEEQEEIHPGEVETTFYLTADGHLVERTLEYDPWEDRNPVATCREVEEAAVRARGVRIPERILTPHPARDVVRPNEERDAYIYRQYLDGVAAKEIVAEVNKRPDWEHFDHDDPDRRVDAALKAMRRHCEHRGLTVPTRKRRQTRLNST